VTEIQQNRWDQLVRRAANIVGGGSQVNDTLNELFPVLDVENVPAELLVLGGVSICQGGGVVLSGATEGTYAQLFNPVGSSVLITITSVRAAFTATTTARWGTAEPERGVPQDTELFRDTRRLLPNQPAGTVNEESEVALATATNQTRILANEQLIITDPNDVAVLAPGTGFEIGSSTGAMTMTYQFYWRERVAEPSELSL